jgi:hypothetical protein
MIKDLDMGDYHGLSRSVLKQSQQPYKIEARASVTHRKEMCG